MKAKTIFLNDLDETIIYDSSWHTDNHDTYMKTYYSNLKITEYIPLLLTKYNHCIIDLSKPYLLGTIYLPNEMSLYQKEFFMNNIDKLEEYTLYINGHSLEKSVKKDKILDVIKLLPVRQKEKKL